MSFHRLPVQSGAKKVLKLELDPLLDVCATRTEPSGLLPRDRAEYEGGQCGAVG